MTEEEREESYKDIIEKYANVEIDWDNPPGAASIALESLMENHNPESDRVTSESIDDLSRSYESKAEFYNSVMKPLRNIRKLKWWE